jgi:hypothetical protein
MSNDKRDSKVIVVDQGTAVRCNFAEHHIFYYPSLSSVEGLADFVSEVLKADRRDERAKHRYIVARSGTATDERGTALYQVFERHNDWVVETWEPYKGHVDNDPVTLGKARTRLGEILLIE